MLVRVTALLTLKANASPAPLPANTLAPASVSATVTCVLSTWVSTTVPNTVVPQGGPPMPQVRSNVRVVGTAWAGAPKLARAASATPTNRRLRILVAPNYRHHYL